MDVGRGEPGHVPRHGFGRVLQQGDEFARFPRRGLAGISAADRAKLEILLTRRAENLK
ncbi:hypothetical protein [Amycolatopsis anabasis]|uniref:hypothetical protein n=1 Tax=Amycolatopsis anabasis TaxID=1840409 RepID=UPI00131ECC8F|nr:hypothetical protein [Amycolatopsis anabasis]